MNTDTERKTIFVCSACGKQSHDKNGDNPISKGWDESCVLHAVLCYEDSLNYDSEGLVIKGDAVE
jgi:predicted metal-binding protein